MREPPRACEVSGLRCIDGDRWDAALYLDCGGRPDVYAPSARILVHDHTMEGDVCVHVDCEVASVEDAGEDVYGEDGEIVACRDIDAFDPDDKRLAELAVARMICAVITESYQEPL